jgi:hypothetical protein
MCRYPFLSHVSPYVQVYISESRVTTWRYPFLGHLSP